MWIPVNVTDDKGKPVQDTWADNSPKTDDKGQPVYKTQDRQVAKDDLDKDKNKDAAVLGALTAMGLGEGDPYPAWQKDDAGKLKLDKDGHAIADPFTISYKPEDAVTGKAGDAKDPQTFNFHYSAMSVIAPHGFSFMFIQACIAILILVGFESVTAMGEEAKNAKQDIPRAVLLSLAIQGAVCYLFEYFAANYFLQQRLHHAQRRGLGRADRRHDGDRRHLAVWQRRGRQGVHAGASVHRVPGADRHDVVLPQHRRARDLRDGPGRGSALALRPAAWQNAVAAPRDLDAGDHLDHHWHRYGGGVSGRQPRPAALDKHNSGTASASSRRDAYAKLPNTLVIITLISNFGTFLLYMTTCIIAIVAFKEHHSFNGFKHFVIPIFGLVANLAACCST